MHARARGYVPAALALGPSLPPTVDVELRRDWTRSLNLGLGTGLGAAGVVLLAAGTTVTIRGAHTYRSVSATLPNDQPLDRPTTDALTASIRTQTIGYGLLGASAGSGVVAITNALGAGRRALVAEASVGAALLLTGAIGLPLTVASYAAVDPLDATLADADRRRLGDHLFGATLGAGVALTSGALISLIVRTVTIERGERRKSSTLQPALEASPHAASLGLRGRF